MRNAITSQPVYPVEDYETDLAEAKLARTQPRPETRGVNWSVVVWFGSFLAVLFSVMLIGAIYALKFAGWV